MWRWCCCKKRLHSICRCSGVTASVPLTRAKLRAWQTRQRKASLLNQKQRLCRNWAQQKARAALINRLLPGCMTKQETGSYNIWLSRPHRWNVSLLLPTKSQTLPKARTQKRRKREKKQIAFAEQAGFLELPHDRSCCTTEGMTGSFFIASYPYFLCEQNLKHFLQASQELPVSFLHGSVTIFRSASYMVMRAITETKNVLVLFSYVSPMLAEYQILPLNFLSCSCEDSLIPSYIKFGNTL